MNMPQDQPLDNIYLGKTLNPDLGGRTNHEQDVLAGRITQDQAEKVRLWQPVEENLSDAQKPIWDARKLWACAYDDDGNLKGIAVAPDKTDQMTDFLWKVYEEKDHCPFQFPTHWRLHPWMRLGDISIYQGNSRLMALMMQPISVPLLFDVDGKKWTLDVPWKLLVQLEPGQDEVSCGEQWRWWCREVSSGEQ